MQWNKEQQIAIDHRINNLLISAGAGSGKTAVLTERVFQLIKSGVDIDYILVLTFTNAAAHEMKDRIRVKLNDIHHPSASKVDASYIMTFDAFALAIVKQYHYLLNIDEGLGLIDEKIYQLMLTTQLINIFDQFYEQQNGPFITFIKSYFAGNEQPLINFIIKVYRKLEMMVDQKGYLDTYIDHHFSDTFFEKHYHEYLLMIKQLINEVISKYEQLNHDTYRQEVLEKLLPLNDLNDVDSLYDFLLAYQHPRIKPSYQIDSQDKQINDGLKKMLKSIKEKVTFIKTTNQFELFKQSKTDVALIVSILKRLDEQINQFKSQHHQYVFSDIAKFAIQLALKDDVRANLKSTFKYILVDEYQDTNDIQNYFIDLIAADNLFLVGDIKQSIYRFRNANCDLFNERYQKYRAGQGGQKLDMNRNYRSNPLVIDYINQIFTSLMNVSLGGVNYYDNHQIIFSNHKYKTDNQPALQVYQYAKNQYTQDDVSQEIKIICHDIIEKVQQKYQVLTKAGYRDISYEDFAILIDRRKTFDQFKVIFNEFGIPLNAPDTEPLVNSDVINIFKNLIKLIVKCQDPLFPNNALHELMSVWRSYVISDDDETIFNKINQIKQGQLINDATINKIQQIYASYINKPLKDILYDLVFTFDIEAKLYLIGNVASHAQKLEQFINWAASLEPFDYTLVNIAQLFDQFDHLSFDLSLDIASVSGPGVLLTTIHKSKGLEFPVVYYPQLFSEFNFRELQESFLFKKDFGIQLPVLSLGKQKTIFQELIIHHEKEGLLSEEIRKFYVALTRARQQMIFLYPDVEPKLLLSKMSINCYGHLIEAINLPEKFGVFAKSDLIETPIVAQISEDLHITFKDIDVKKEPIEKVKASSEFIYSDPSALQFGTMLHDYLSLIDWKNPQIEQIQDAKIQAIIKRTIALPLFNHIKLAQVYQEYHFFDHINHTEGIIDLMLVYPDQISIIDFKTSSIDHEGYVRQLKYYQQYLKTIDKKPVKMFLVSLLNNEYREIK